MKLTRKQFLTLIGSAAVTLPKTGMSSVAALARPNKTAKPEAAGPVASRIKYATIGAPDVAAVERLYTGVLGHTVVERSKVSEPVARSWGTPNAAGRPFVLMRPATGEDVLIRAVEIEPVKGYKAMTTWGWNSFEIIVNDVDDLHERMKNTEFRHIGGPANLGGGTSSIRASQYIGPAEEVLYFNCETGDRSKSGLPDPGDDVGRTNIFILAGPSVDDAMAFYGSAFGLPEGSSFPTPIGVIQRAQGLPEGTMFTMGFSRLREKGNAIEFDQYPQGTGPRPRAPGHLPPGNAIASFNVDSLDAVNVDFISEPIVEYRGSRSAAFVGPAGEIVELIEQQR